MKLSDDQLNTFEEQGFVVVENFYEEEKRARIAAALRETIPPWEEIKDDPPGERFQRRIGPTTEYAPYLEFGTGRGLHPAGRPFVIPALQLEEKAFIEAVAQTYKQVIERG